MDDVFDHPPAQPEEQCFVHSGWEVQLEGAVSKEVLQIQGRSQTWRSAQAPSFYIGRSGGIVISTCTSIESSLSKKTEEITDSSDSAWLYGPEIIGMPRTGMLRNLVKVPLGIFILINNFQPDKSFWRAPESVTCWSLPPYTEAISTLHSIWQTSLLPHQT